MIDFVSLKCRTAEIPSDVLIGKEEGVGCVVEGNRMTESRLEDQFECLFGFFSRLQVDGKGSWMFWWSNILAVPDDI
jgi:hypothetical protein